MLVRRVGISCEVLVIVAAAWVSRRIWYWRNASIDEFVRKYSGLDWRAARIAVSVGARRVLLLVFRWVRREEWEDRRSVKREISGCWLRRVRMSWAMVVVRKRQKMSDWNGWIIVRIRFVTVTLGGNENEEVSVVEHDDIWVSKLCWTGERPGSDAGDGNEVHG